MQQRRPERRHRSGYGYAGHAAGWLVTALFLPFLTSGDDRPTQLKEVQQRGSLTLLTRNGASSYYLGAEGPTGPEFELVSAFSEYLGVELEIEVADTFHQLSALLNAQQRNNFLISDGDFRRVLAQGQSQIQRGLKEAFVIDGSGERRMSAIWAST